MGGIKYIFITLTLVFLILLGIFSPSANEIESINVEVLRETFTETSKEIDNPDRGLYSIIGFYITDQEEDFQDRVDRFYQDDTPTNLAMIQINLAHYSDRALSMKALENIGNLFSLLRTKERSLIVRFVYDWDGKAKLYEPQSIDIIINHMAQLKDILHANQDQILMLQGLFTGNWGEMNGTHYSAPEDLRRLAEALLDAAGESTFLSVRTGSHWRTITGVHEPEVLLAGNVPRIGLYNDGMMGNETDCGSYYPNSDQDSEPMAAWSRDKELAFQDLLCRHVPNGGEAILSNPMNDFENAVATLKTMHVSYLNYDYDKNVIEKWAAVSVDSGTYKGLDGLTYIERHLGYRILIDDVKVAFHKPRKKLILDLDLKNVGFAPKKYKKDIKLQVYNENNELVLDHLFDQDIRQLYGGDNSGDLMELHHEISLKDWPTGEYTIYLTINDRKTGEPLVLANEQSITSFGYKIAGIRRS